MGKRASARAFMVRVSLNIAGNPTWVFAIVVTMAVFSSVSSMIYLRGLEDDLGGVYEKEVGGQAYAQNAYAATLALESAAKDLVLAEDARARADAAGALLRQCSSLDATVKKAASTFNSRRYRTLIAKTKAETDDLDSMVQARLSGVVGEAEARSLLGGVLAKTEDLKTDLFKLYDIKRRSSRTWFNAVGIQLRASLLITVAILAVSVAVRVFLYQGQRRVAAAASSAEVAAAEEDAAPLPSGPPSRPGGGASPPD